MFYCTSELMRRLNRPEHRNRALRKVKCSTHWMPHGDSYCMIAKTLPWFYGENTTGTTSCYVIYADRLGSGEAKPSLCHLALAVAVTVRPGGNTLDVWMDPNNADISWIPALLDYKNKRSLVLSVSGSSNPVFTEKIAYAFHDSGWYVGVNNAIGEEIEWDGNPDFGQWVSRLGLNDTYLIYFER